MKSNSSRLSRFLMNPLLWFLAFSSFSNASIEEQWEQSLQQISKNGLYLPGEMQYRNNLLDRTGKHLNSFAALCELDWSGSKPTVISTLMLNSKPNIDHKDTLNTERDIEKTIEYLLLDLPFFTVNSPKLIGNGNKTKSIDGIDCRGFEFEVDFNAVSVRGTSWLDTDTALPRQLELWITNFEYASEDRKIIHFYRSIVFSTSEDKPWRAVKMTDNIWFIRRVLLKDTLFMEEKTFEFGKFRKSDL